MNVNTKTADPGANPAQYMYHAWAHAHTQHENLIHSTIVVCMRKEALGEV